MRTLVRVLGTILVVILIVGLLASSIFGGAIIAAKGWFYGHQRDQALKAQVTVECTVMKTCPDSRHTNRSTQPSATKPQARANQPVTPARPQPASATSKDVLDIHVHAEGTGVTAVAKMWVKQQDEPCCQPMPAPQPAPVVRREPTPPVPEHTPPPYSADDLARMDAMRQGRVQTPDEPLLQTMPAPQPPKQAISPATKPPCKGSRPPC